MTPFASTFSFFGALLSTVNSVVPRLSPVVLYMMGVSCVTCFTPRLMVSGTAIIAGWGTEGSSTRTLQEAVLPLKMRTVTTALPGLTLVIRPAPLTTTTFGSEDS